MIKKMNISYIIEAFCYLEGKVYLQDLYDELDRLLPLNQLNNYESTASYQGTIRDLIESHSIDSNKFFKHNFFKHIDRGIWQFQKPYLDNLKLINNNLQIHEKVEIWWECGFPELCAITKKSIYFLSSDPDPMIIKGSIVDAKITSDNEWMTLFFNSIDGQTWEIGHVHDPLIINKLKSLLTVSNPD